ncbi:MAG TPA: hypothetical protein VNG89_13960 [Vicinamibacterales bacterium]|jgi:hypothetical protein|nr:hypothetical protein [Vicinamibacterales bacterium]
MPDDPDPAIQAALDAIVIARDAAAAPLVFTPDAAKASDDRSIAQFRANLPLVNGGFAVVKEGMLHASALFGALAKTIAQFDDPAATVINLEQMSIARTAAERACKLTLARTLNKALESVSATDGHICRGGG